MMINNIQTTFTTQNTFLHHGIQGQKWGVTNGPPYPLEDYISDEYIKDRYDNDWDLYEMDSLELLTF